MAKLRIIVADDSQFMRIAYKRILDTQDNFEVVGMAEDGQEALDKALELEPDVAILDIRMPKMDGLQTAHHILEQHPNTAIVMISAYDDLNFVRELLNEGPQQKAYLLKNSLDDIGELIRVVEAVSNGQTVLDPVIVEKISNLSANQPTSTLSQLTETEQKVLGLMAKGFDDYEIGLNLQLGQEHVRTYTTSIYEKLELNEEATQARRNQAILAFVNQGSSAPKARETEANT